MTTDFRALMDGLRAGDGDAEAAVFRRYVHRLVALAARQFDTAIRERADVEDVVQSALARFFVRHKRQGYDLDDWEKLWALLAVITLNKCAKRRAYLQAGRRKASREVPSSSEPGDQGPASR